MIKKYAKFDTLSISREQSILPNTTTERLNSEVFKNMKRTQQFPLFALLCLLTLLCLLVGCSKETDDDSRSTSNSSGDSGRAFSTFCGVPLGGEVRNPITDQQGVSVRILGPGSTPGSVVILKDSGAQVVKLRALSEQMSESAGSRATAVISAFGADGFLYTDDCQFVTADGALSIVGDIINNFGDSLAESLLEKRAAEVSSAGDCGQALVAGCYQSLLEASEVQDDIPSEELPGASAPGKGNSTPGASVSNFLWKPSSERNGNLVVLLNPAGATVIVNETTVLEGSGPSNGRGTTARANKPGAAFGTNVRVEAIDGAGRSLVFPDGKLFVTIPNGAQRFEF